MPNDTCNAHRRRHWLARGFSVEAGCVACLLAACLAITGCNTVEDGRKLPPNPYVRPSQDERNSWFGSWFGPKEPDPPESVADFLRLERP